VSGILPNSPVKQILAYFLPTIKWQLIFQLATYPTIFLQDVD